MRARSGCNLEVPLGVRLLQRTTRRVSATSDGAAFYERCAHILAVMYPQNRHLSAKVRIFVDWISELIQRDPICQLR